MISHCVQENDRLKQERTESVQLASTSQDKAKKRKRDKRKEAAIRTSQNKVQKKQDTIVTCFFWNILFLLEEGWSCEEGLS